MRLLLGLFLLLACGASAAQSGHATLHGWVNFENVAYVDRQPVMANLPIQLRASARGKNE